MTTQQFIDNANRLTDAICNATCHASKDRVGFTFGGAHGLGCVGVYLAIEDAERIANELLNAAREARGEDGE